MGVDIFFAVSGLLITTQLLQDSDLKRFYIRRAFRILPPVFLYLGAVFALHLIDSRDLWHCLSMLRNYGTGSEYTTHFWTLSLEEQFYLAWPLVLLLSGKRAPKVAIAGIIAVCAWRAFAWHLGMNYSRTDMRSDGLLWGCVSAFVLRTGDIKFGKFIPAICVVCAFFVWSIPIFMPVMPIMWTCAVLGTVQKPTWAFSRLLEWRPLVWIGQRSYGIYVWQSLFIFVPVPIPMTVKIAAVIVWSAVLYEYVESPLRSIGRTLTLRSGRVYEQVA